MTVKRKKFIAYLSEQHHKALMRISKETGKSASEVVRNAIQYRAKYRDLWTDDEDSKIRKKKAPSRDAT